MSPSKVLQMCHSMGGRNHSGEATTHTHLQSPSLPFTSLHLIMPLSSSFIVFTCHFFFLLRHLVQQQMKHLLLLWSIRSFCMYMDCMYTMQRTAAAEKKSKKWICPYLFPVLSKVRQSHHPLFYCYMGHVFSLRLFLFGLLFLHLFPPLEKAGTKEAYQTCV